MTLVELIERFIHARAADPTCTKLTTHGWRLEYGQDGDDNTTGRVWVRFPDGHTISGPLQA